MQEYEPQIVELEPEKAPRTSAIILLICGLLGVGFLMVNVVFTGEDPYHSGWWPEEDEGTIQEQGNIIPNVWRGAGENDEEEEVEDVLLDLFKPTTNPFTIPGYEQFMRRPSLTGPQSTPGKPTPTTPPKPGTPATPGRTTSGTPAPNNAPPK